MDSYDKSVSLPRRVTFMFTKIVVALNDLPESQRALRTAIELARVSDAELATVSILGDLPAYTSFAIIVDPDAPNAMEEERRRAHGELVCIERAGEEQRGISVEMGLASEALRHE
jgi:nucleotide-binding universal stress UspA family protein